MGIASLIWEITKANISWGGVRIANQLALLNIFISASTVRNILNRTKLPKQPISQTKSEKTEEKKDHQSLHGIQIMSGLSIPQWFFAGDFGQYMFVLSLTIFPVKSCP
jgi:hypothetical protein